MRRLIYRLQPLHHQPTSIDGMEWGDRRAIRWCRHDRERSHAAGSDVLVTPHIPLLHIQMRMVYERRLAVR